MLAVILIGGAGTRLRPFTLDTPKPLLPVVNRPFLEYQFEVLRAHGVKDVVLCTSYQAQVFKKSLGDGRRQGLRIRYVHETEPLGTGGALKNAQELLTGTTIVLNGDVLNALDVTQFLKFHKKNRAEVTIALTRVKDPTAYGLVETAPDGRIKKFLEKPSWDEVETNTVNAGGYLFEPHVLNRIPKGVHYSLERSLFPQLLQDKSRLFGWVTSGYWIDIGTVEKYLQVHHDILRGTATFKIAARRHASGALLGAGVRLGRELTVDTDGGRRVLLGEATTVGDFARFSGPVCVGPRCAIGKGASLSECVVLEGASIGEGATLKGCIVGEGAAVGANAVLSAQTALAGGSRVEAFSSL